MKVKANTVYIFKAGITHALVLKAGIAHALC